MRIAQMLVRRPPGRTREKSGGIAANQRKPAFAKQVVPQFFQANRRIEIPLLAQQPHHLTIGSDFLAAAYTALDEIANDTIELALVRPACHHELVQRFLCIQGDQGAVLITDY